MLHGWESDRGLDPEDAKDAHLDQDGDRHGNFQEHVDAILLP